MTPLLGLDVLDDEVAVAGLGVWGGRGLDLDVRLGRGRALEVLQALLDVAQVQEIAGTRGNGRGEQGGAAEQCGRRVRRRADGSDATGHERQRQRAGGEILRRSQHASGDPALGNDGLLSARKDHVDASRAQAAANRRIIALWP
jgi:hypothetical protein